MDIGRRDILRIAGAGALVSAASPLLATTSTSVTNGFDYTSDAGRLKTVVLMRGALDDRLCTNWVRARYFGIIGDEMKPMFGVISVVFNRFRPMADGGYQFATLEVAYFTDHNCTQALDTYENPYTGEEVRVPEGGLPASGVRIGPDLRYSVMRDLPGTKLQHTFFPVYQAAEEVWLTESTNAAVSLPGGVPRFRYQDVTTYHAPRAEVAHPDAMAITSRVGYSSVTSWRPWLNMPAGTSGHLSAFGSGLTNSRMEDVPQAWIDATAVRNPHLLDDPAAALDPIWNP